MSPSLQPIYHYESEQERRMTRFVFATIIGMVFLNVPASLFHWGWKSAAFNTLFVWALNLAFAWRNKDRRLLGWLILGVAAGFTELIADAWLVYSTKSLVYASPEPMIWASPAYMPGAWALIILQMGVIAHWLRDRMKLPWAMLATALFCGVNIPLYEHLAKGADWWFYQDTPMLFAAPYYIIVGEMLLGLPLVLMAWVMDRKPLAYAVPLGVLQGLVILVSYVIAWWLVGPCEGAVIQFACR